MNARLAFTALVALAGISGSAQADIYAAGPVFGGNPTGGIVSCRVLNTGTTNLSIVQRQIIANTNVLITPTFDSCNVVLAPLRNCSYGASISGNVALACRLVTTGVDPMISGSIDVQNPVGTVRVVEPLQAQ